MHNCAKFRCIISNSLDAHARNAKKYHIWLSSDVSFQGTNCLVALIYAKRHEARLCQVLLSALEHAKVTGAEIRLPFLLFL